MRYQFLLGAAAVALAIPAAVSAQETTSSIRGSVTNAGAPVADATVVATDVASGTRAQTTTGNDGGFTLSGLRPGGPYTIEVTSASGNKSVTDIFTVVQQAYSLPIELAEAATDAGAAGPDVVVTATSIRGAGVASAGPTTLLTQADISKVASVNRDIRDIQRRDPFASLDLTNSGERGGAVSFAGVNPRFNRFTINGVQVGDTFGLNQDASPTNRGPVPFDAIGQVSVSIAPYDFRQGGFQGGAIDTVLLSGTNDFHGTGFYSQNTDGLSGSRIGSFKLNPDPKFKSETYGATFRGPLIADKLFFMVSAERNTDPRPFSTQVGNIPNLSTATIGNVIGVTNATYAYNPGNVLSINPRKDEKIVGRIDWNVTDGQRLSLSYINAFDSLVSQNNTSTSNTSPSYGLESNAYTLTELLRAGIVQLNSDWTDNFSTEARGIYRWTRRGQEPLLGRGIAQFRVCTDAASQAALVTCATPTGSTAAASPIVAFGPDASRQTNELFFDTWAGSLLARYRAGDHEVKMFAEFNENRTFNNFLQNSSGAYYFDSLADYGNRLADQLVYATPLNGQANGAAADFRYSQYTFGLQDDWQVTDALLITYAVRYDLFGMRDTPAYNPFFQTRYGFPNTQTYKGLDNFQPRFSFRWKSPFGVQLRGGAGIFGGGSPDIYLSNSFSNTILANNVNFNRSAPANSIGLNGPQSQVATCTGGIPNAICTAALNNVTGQIPQIVQDYVRGASGNAPATNTGALAPDFRLPSSLKATLSADYKLYGFNIGADYYFSKTNQSVVFTDIRSQVVGTLPDGRPRYGNPFNGFANANYDILLTNTQQGRSHIGTVRFDKQFDWGLSFGGSYTLQDVRDVSPATSSTILSNYGNIAAKDPNRPALGKGYDETTWQFKYNVGFDHAFFGDYRTVVQLFGETRAGRRYSFTMQDVTGSNNARSAVFGTISNNDRYLLYVPTSTTDAIVSYDTTATRDSLDALINATNLKKYRGKIADKNIARNRAFTRIDLHLEQELPTFIGKSRVSLFADVNNLPNLLNSKWGGVRAIGFPATSAVVQVQCLNAPVLTGATPGAGVVNTTSAQACTQYRYSSFRNPESNLTPNFTPSLYAVRLGARFTF